ncbi:MAG TPA: class I SAM-dependent methyltransferase [Polyangiaceae bacterium]|nr:class I SAM-dependent methyltransferase [Polyangiaceae bacterium]
MTVRTDSFVPGPDELRRVFAGKSTTELVFFARQCLERGGHDQVLALSEAFEATFAADATLALTAAVARFVGGEREAAAVAVEELVRAHPADLNALSVLAEMRARSGDRAASVALFTRLIELFPDYPGAQPTLAALLMPGPSYREVLRALHARLAPRTYLEIGVASGATLSLATGAELAVGVDPVEAPLEHPLPARARLIRTTSAAFFAKHRCEDVFGPRAVELTFIDGLHLFEAALADFAGAEAWSNPSSTIVLHDCVPIAPVTARRERATRFWVGDTWKAAWALARYRPDLRIRTLLAPPSGLVVVRGLDPSSRVLERERPRILGELMPLEYPCPVGSYPDELHVVPNTPEGLAEALGA